MAKYSFSFLDNACFGHYDGSFAECSSKCKSSRACMAATESDMGDEVRRRFKLSSREISGLVDSFGGRNDSFREDPAAQKTARPSAKKTPKQASTAAKTRSAKPARPAAKCPARTDHASKIAAKAKKPPAK